MPVPSFCVKVGFFWLDLLVVRGSSPSIGNMWVLALVVAYLHAVRCWCGCLLLTAGTIYIYLAWGQLPSVTVVVIVSCRPYASVEAVIFHAAINSELRPFLVIIGGKK